MIRGICTVLGIIIAYLLASNAVTYNEYITLLKQKDLKRFTITHHSVNHYTTEKIVTDVEIYAYKIEYTDDKNNSVICYDKENNVVGMYKNVICFGITY